MAPSSSEKGLGPGFYDYLDGLREEFRLQFSSTSGKSARPHRFNSYLDGLKCEFEVMTEDMETLQKERRELEVKVEAQALELRHNNVVCQQCSRSIARNIGSSPLKTLEAFPSSASHAHHPITPTRSTSNTISDPTVAHLQAVTLPSPLLQASDPILNPDSAPEVRDTSTNEAGKELRIEMVHELSHREPIWCVNFSQDGKYLAAGCHDGNSYVYDAQTGKLIRVLRDLLAEKDFIRAVCFSGDGKYLATGSKYNGIYIWEIDTKYVRNAFKGNPHWIRSIDFSPNGRLLISASGRDIVRLWNMRDGATKDLTDVSPKVIDPYYTSAVFSPSGGFVAASHSDGMVRIWHVRTGQLLRRVKAHKDITFDVGFTPDEKGLVSGSRDTTLKYWDFSYPKPSLILARWRTSDLFKCVSALEKRTRPEREYSGHNASACCLSISSDGRWVASGSFDKTVGICIWDIRSGVVQHSLNHNKRVCSVHFSPAAQYLACGEYDGMVRIWRYL